jgi:phospholipid transport system substrate-binding protein
MATRFLMNFSLAAALAAAIAIPSATADDRGTSGTGVPANLYTKAMSCPAADIVRGAASALSSAAQRGSASAFGSVLTRYADVGAIAMFALGKYGSKLPAARQSEYVANTQRYISQVLMEKSGPFKNSPNLTIETCDGNLVGTSLNGRSKMQWRLSGARIRDVSVSGVWLAIQLRTTFTDVIRRNRGDISAILEFLSA